MRFPPSTHTHRPHTPTPYTQIYLDGVSQKLPQLEGVVILNINSWSAGCSVWNDTSTGDQFGSSRWGWEWGWGWGWEWGWERDGGAAMLATLVGEREALPSFSHLLACPPSLLTALQFPHRIDDELLEVVGLYSSLHVGKIQVSLAEPLRLGQASEIKVSNLCGQSLLNAQLMGHRSTCVGVEPSQCTTNGS